MDREKIGPTVPKTLFFTFHFQTTEKVGSLFLWVFHLSMLRFLGELERAIENNTRRNILRYISDSFTCTNSVQ